MDAEGRGRGGERVGGTGRGGRGEQVGGRGRRVVRSTLELQTPVTTEPVTGLESTVGR